MQQQSVLDVPENFNRLGKRHVRIQLPCRPATVNGGSFYEPGFISN
jgi:hypothetical protein